jgi:hypothetical protein
MTCPMGCQQHSHDNPFMYCFAAAENRCGGRAEQQGGAACSCSYCWKLVHGCKLAKLLGRLVCLMLPWLCGCRSGGSQGHGQAIRSSVVHSRAARGSCIVCTACCQGGEAGTICCQPPCNLQGDVLVNQLQGQGIMHSRLVEALGC